MGELMEAAGAIVGLAFGAIVILLLSPQLDPLTPVNLAGIGMLFLTGAVVLTIGLIIVGVRMLLSSV